MTGPKTKQRILVVDDDPSILRLVSAVLTRANFQVETASGGRAALDKLDLAQYDAVVLDLMMPDVNGFDVLAALKDRASPPACIVIMSAASPDTVAKTVGGNVFAALRKPFEISEMISTVRACIAAGPVEDSRPRLSRLPPNSLATN